MGQEDLKFWFYVVTGAGAVLVGWVIKLSLSIKQAAQVPAIWNTIDDLKLRLSSLEQSNSIYKHMLSPEALKEHHVTITELRKDVEYLERVLKQ